MSIRRSTSAALDRDAQTAGPIVRHAPRRYRAPTRLLLLRRNVGATREPIVTIAGACISSPVAGALRGGAARAPPASSRHHRTRARRTTGTDRPPWTTHASGDQREATRLGPVVLEPSGAARPWSVPASTGYLRALARRAGDGLGGRAHAELGVRAGELFADGVRTKEQLPRDVRPVLHRRDRAQRLCLARTEPDAPQRLRQEASDLLLEQQGARIAGKRWTVRRRPSRALTSAGRGAARLPLPGFAKLRRPDWCTIERRLATESVGEEGVPVGADETIARDRVQESRSARRRAVASRSESEREPLAGRHARSSSFPSMS
jgi:hypothetical protein